MASYFPGIGFPSIFSKFFLQKRLLSYALSRLEIFETDHLDLENLDIVWGKKSTFEFRDVGLRLKKLETLMQLPSSFEVTKARVLLLRLTIPVDIYASPIQVDVEGVECQLRVRSKSEKDAHRDRRRKRPQTKDTGPGGRRGSDYAEDDDLEPTIPTAADLAQSFLQARPEEEKAELEAAILSETQEFDSGSVLSDDGEFHVGTGEPITLPAVIVGFLQGIVDRLRVRIHGIVLNLELEIPNDSSRSPITDSIDPVTVQLRIEDIDIEGVTQALQGSDTNNQTNQNLPYKDGKRLISLSKIRGTLISEANLFSSLAQSSAMSSPSAAHSDISEGKNSFHRSSSAHEGTDQAFEGGSEGRESIASLQGLSTPSIPKHLSGLRSPRDSVVLSEGGRFDDASEGGSNMSGSIRDSMSDVGESVLQNSAYFGQITESDYLGEEETEARRPLLLSHDFRESQSPSSTPRASMIIQPLDDRESNTYGSPSGSPDSSMPNSTLLPARPYSRFSESRLSQSQSQIPEETDLTRLREISTLEHALEASQSSIGSGINEEDEDSNSDGEDLTQSKMFNHEDAESLYLSAISHSPSVHIPGGWTESSDENDDESSVSRSQYLPQVQVERLDNLEHARQHSPLDQSTASIADSVQTAKTSASSHFTANQTKASIPQLSSVVSDLSTTSSERYSKLTKTILSLDRVDIYVPALNQDAPTGANSSASGVAQRGFEYDLAESTSIDVPGAFSGHLPRQKPRARSPLPNHPPKVPEARPQPKDLDIEVAIGNLSTQFDISVGRLLFMIIRQLQVAITQSLKPTTNSKSGSGKAESKSGSSNFKLSAEKIAIAFVERLEGSLGSRRTSTAIDAIPDSDVLLQTTLKGLNIISRASVSASKTAVTIQKFIFGYAKENIVSFDPELQMHASVRDLKAAEGIDLRVNVIKNGDVTRIEAVTLPIHVAIDLQRLDETFSWFGGLSSVLNLGSSIASNSTITATSPGKPKSRGVHFETPTTHDDKSQVAQHKPEIRIGGFILDLVGTECSIGVETSAVKIINRDDVIGVSVQAIRLSGPHLKHSHSPPAIIAKIASTRIDFLSTPEEQDLNRLLALITPSKTRFDSDDDIMVDTLLRQRRQGAVLRLKMDSVKIKVDNLDDLSYLPELGEEVSRLATVAKYLPDDERPGLLSLVSIREFGADVNVNDALGSIKLASTDMEVAQITLPALIALSLNTISVHRNSSEELVGAATDPELREPSARFPAIMVRMIGNEMEPVVKFQVWNLKIEYRVPTLMTIIGLVEGATAQDMSASMVASVATLIDFARTRSPQATRKPLRSDSPTSKPLSINVGMRDCILGLNPLGLPSKLLVCLTEAQMTASVPKDKKTSATVNLTKAYILVIDNIANIISGDLTNQPRRNTGSKQTSDLCTTGFVSVGEVSSAKVVLVLSTDTDDEQCIDVELRDDLFVLESCADSTQTLVAILGALAPPSIPSLEKKYRTKVIPVQDLLKSLSADAFGTAEGNYDIDEDFDLDEFDLDSQLYSEDEDDDIMAGLNIPETSTKLSSRDTHEGVLVNSFQDSQEPEPEGELNFVENHFGTGSVLEGTAHRWNSSRNTYDRSSAPKVRKSPLKVCVRDVNFIWKLFDGYDWPETRNTITRAVQDVESKANERRARTQTLSTFEQDIDDEDDMIGDFLFNSIYIGVPANRDPRELAAAISHELQLHDNLTETESIATTTVSSGTSRQGGVRRPKHKSLRLNRSKRHKIAFELEGVNIDVVTFPPGSGETQSSVDVRVRNLEVTDLIPTSTWKSFATYMQEAGERETGSNMIHLEILNVKPVPELAAAEIVLRATILPLRLHVDQDALDFITRFFEFKDDSAPVRPPSSPGDIPFIQRAEVNSVVVKLDFKPKRVDYAGLRSGHTTEFMNFLILDQADMVLRHTIIYGVTGFEKLGKCLNDIWMPDIKKNQLPGILAGLAPVRSIVNVGEGMGKLVKIPLQEYKKDGRIVRGISKGAQAFAKTTGTELVKLGAKFAIGVQTVLQGAEGFLGPPMETSVRFEDGDSEEETKQISLYANQPVGVLQGLRGGYTGLRRDLVTARDAIIAIPTEVMESGNAAGVLKAVRKHAPVVILRPPIGIAKAAGKTLMGATNSLDPGNLQRADAKYKKH